MAQARPVIKWVGGKTQLLPTLLDIFPKRARTYYEPFIGGGAVFFALAAAGRFEQAVLNDQNAELVNLYRVVRDFPEELMAWLSAREARYEQAPAAVYEATRNPDALMAKEMSDPIAQAGRFIFLNKAGFNGLYRVNRSGDFNVSWGKKLVVRTHDPENIRACAEVLNGVTLRQGDFADVCQTAGEGDLVYLDPPYVPLTPTSSFTSYTKDGFGLQDQQRLVRLVEELTERGAAVVVSNSDTPLTRELYGDFEIHEIQARRNANSKGDRRGPVGELIVVNRSCPRPLSLEAVLG